MAYNSSGVYSLPAGSTITNGDTSDASDLNTPLADLAAAHNAARPIVAGGTGATTAAGARTNLGVVLGTDVQAYDAGLQSIAGLTTAADKMIYTTASDTYATADLSVFARTLLDDADAATARATLGASYASQVEAEAGTATGVVMSPLRVSQAITALTPDAFDTLSLAAGSIEAKMAQGFQFVVGSDTSTQDAEETFTFANSFTFDNACVAVFVQLFGAGAGDAGIGVGFPVITKTTTGFSITRDSDLNGNHDFLYIAVGY